MNQLLACCEDEQGVCVRIADFFLISKWILQIAKTQRPNNPIQHPKGFISWPVDEIRVAGFFFPHPVEGRPKRQNPNVKNLASTSSTQNPTSKI